MAKKDSALNAQAGQNEAERPVRRSQRFKRLGEDEPSRYLGKPYLFIAFLIAASLFILSAAFWGMGDDPTSAESSCQRQGGCADEIEYGCRNGDVYKYTIVRSCQGKDCVEGERFMGLFATCASGTSCIEGESECSGTPATGATTTTSPPSPGTIKCESSDDCPGQEQVFSCDGRERVILKTTKYYCAVYSGNRCISRTTTETVDSCTEDETCEEGKDHCVPEAP